MWRSSLVITLVLLGAPAHAEEVPAKLELTAAWQFALKSSVAAREAQSATVSISGVGVAPDCSGAGTGATAGSAGRFGRTLQHHDVFVARVPEPEDVAVAQLGPLGIERAVVDVHGPLGAGVVDGDATVFRDDPVVICAQAGRSRWSVEAGADPTVSVPVSGSAT